MSEEMPTLGAKPPSPSGDQTNQFRFVLDVILRHWVLILVLTLLSGIGGALIGHFLEVDHYEYEAFGDLYVKQSVWNSPIMANVGGGIFAQLSPKVLKDQTNVRLLSRDIAKALVHDDIQTGAALSTVTSDEELDHTASSIQMALVLENLDTEGILRVRARSDDPQEAERYAEMALRVLIEHTRDLQVNEQEEAHGIIREQLNELRYELDRAESLQWDYRERMGFQTHEQLWRDMERRNSELLDASTEKEEAEAKLLELDAALLENNQRLPDALGNVTDSIIQDLLSELDELRREQVNLSVVWQADYPGIVALEDEIAEKKMAVMLAIGELDVGVGGGSNLWSQRQDLYRQKVDLELSITGLDIRKAAIERMLKEMIARLPELADQNFEYDQLAHEAEQIRDQFNRMLAKEFEIKTALNRGSATVERRDAVVMNSYFSGEGLPALSSGLLGAMIGFIVAFSLSMMNEMTDTSIKTIEDATEALGIETIGMIPEMKFGKPGAYRRRRGAHVVATDEEQVDACIVTQHDPKSPISEAYRSFRTNFQFATLQQKPKTVMLTSAVPGEGKTTTAVNFAVTMADRGMRVLIVDTDLRRPNVHRVLKMERGPGLSDVLRERIPIKNVIRPTRTENLWIISSGRVPPNPSELIGSERMRHLMDELGETFDLVVCDAPSVLVVTDPVLLATHVDTVVLVVSVNNARRETIQRAKKLLETANPVVAGVVLNGLEATRRHYYYYYYYYDDRVAPGRRKWYLNF